jgi:hypothetical protein
MPPPLDRRFALMKWDRLEAWLVVNILLRLAILMLNAAQLLRLCGLISAAGVDRAIEASGELTRRAHAQWEAYLFRRDRLRTDAERFLGHRHDRR